MSAVRQFGFVAAIAVAVIFAPIPAVQAEDEGIVIVMKDDKFIPSDVPVPAGAKVKLIVRNQNSHVSEFESSEFHREKVVQPGTEIIVYVGPLNAGSYEFFDDFHPTTRGHLVVK